ncbi:hypothetical protein B0H19DRAFT_1066493 [Mycena capillaripes]|nr:hypothetical protein B0H19DRAFT_1066493 [Mycena capillaripes]
MSEPAPERRTRVFLACLNCRRSKIKCLTVDSQENPCKRCARKGLICEYRTVAEEREQSANADGTHSYGQQPAPPAAQAASSYPLGSQRPPPFQNAQYFGSMLHGLTPGFAPNPVHNHGGHPDPNQVYLRPQGYNMHGSSAAPPQQPGSSGYSASYGYPANGPGFTSSSNQPQ